MHAIIFSELWLGLSISSIMRRQCQSKFCTLVIRIRKRELECRKDYLILKSLELLLSNPPHFGARVVHISAHLPRWWLLLSLRSRPPTDDERVGSLQRLLRLPLDPLHQVLARWHVMNQPDDLPRGPNAVIHIPIHKDLPPPLPAHKRRHVLKLPARALPLNFDCFLGDFVAKQPTRVPPSPEHELRIRLLCLDDGDFDIVVDGRFDRAHEPRAHVDPLCT